MIFFLVGFILVFIWPSRIFHLAFVLSFINFFPLFGNSMDGNVKLLHGINKLVVMRCSTNEQKKRIKTNWQVENASFGY